MKNLKKNINWMKCSKISSNKKFNIIKKGNQPFQEDIKDNELTQKEIQNLKLKNNSTIKEKTN